MSPGPSVFLSARFLLADGVYAVFGVGIFFFGSAGAITLLHYVGHWLIYVAAAVLGMYLSTTISGHLRRRELRGTAEPPVSVLRGAGAKPGGRSAGVHETGDTTRGGERKRGQDCLSAQPLRAPIAKPRAAHPFSSISRQRRERSTFDVFEKRSAARRDVR